MFVVTTSLLTIALLSPAASQIKDQDHPVVGLVKASVKDTSKPFTLVVRMKVKEGKGQQYEALFAKVAKESRKEKGNRAYDMNRSTKVTNEYLIYERWENLTALEFHLKTPHFLEAAANSGAFADGTPEILIMVPIGD